MAVFWPFTPSSIGERLTFKTDVRRSPMGEMRDSLFGAQQHFNLNFTLPDAIAIQAETLFRTNPLGDWDVPVWHDMTRVVGTILSTDTVIPVNTDAGYIAGGSAVVFLDIDDYALVDVISAIGGSLTIAAPVGKDFVGSASAPVLVAPLRTCAASVGLRLAQDFAVANAGIQFRSKEHQDVAATSFQTHDGLDVLTDPSVLISSLSGHISQASEVLDNGLGAFEVMPTRDVLDARSMAAFSDFDVSARWSRRQWLHQMRGKDRPFWLPTWKQDLQLVNPVTSGATTITVSKMAPAATDLVGRSIQFDDGAGGYVHREITAGADVSDTHVLTIAATGVAYPLTAPVSFINRVRFDTDVFEITHVILPDGFLSQFSASVIEVAA